MFSSRSASAAFGLLLWLLSSIATAQTTPCHTDAQPWVKFANTQGQAFDQCNANVHGFVNISACNRSGGFLGIAIANSTARGYIDEVHICGGQAKTLIRWTWGTNNNTPLEFPAKSNALAACQTVFNTEVSPGWLSQSAGVRPLFNDCQVLNAGAGPVRLRYYHEGALRSYWRQFAFGNLCGDPLASNYGQPGECVFPPPTIEAPTQGQAFDQCYADGYADSVGTFLTCDRMQGFFGAAYGAGKRGYWKRTALVSGVSKEVAQYVWPSTNVAVIETSNRTAALNACNAEFAAFVAPGWTYQAQPMRPFFMECETVGQDTVRLRYAHEGEERLYWRSWSHPAQLCEDPEATNNGEPGDCAYYCDDPAATNYGASERCVMPTVCEDPAADNFGLPFPCHDFPEVAPIGECPQPPEGVYFQGRVGTRCDYEMCYLMHGNGPAGLHSYARAYFLSPDEEGEIQPECHNYWTGVDYGGDTDIQDPERFYNADTQRHVPASETVSAHCWAFNGNVEGGAGYHRFPVWRLSYRDDICPSVDPVCGQPDGCNATDAKCNAVEQWHELQCSLKGEGQSSEATCLAPPTCTGDPASCAELYLQTAMRCTGFASIYASPTWSRWMQTGAGQLATRRIEEAFACISVPSSPWCAAEGQSVQLAWEAATDRLVSIVEGLAASQGETAEQFVQSSERKRADLAAALDASALPTVETPEPLQWVNEGLGYLDEAGLYASRLCPFREGPLLTAPNLALVCQTGEAIAALYTAALAAALAFLLVRRN